MKTVNQADYRLTASTVSGAAGGTVPVTVTVHNAGPAWVASFSAGEPAATVDIDIPVGTSVASAPDTCWSQSETRYRCNTPIYLTESGKPAAHTFPFGLHIDEVIPNATGRAVLYNDAYEPPVRTFDPDLTNNTATLTVNPDELTHAPSGCPARPLRQPCTTASAGRTRRSSLRAVRTSEHPRVGGEDTS
ncbi:hypothetical protein [Streptomyces californicus]|uniref:hypothetical protein n=1 Tax=Streptomyces californicus TaxID=67351 RepID=UPI001E38D40D|nr:hypothetical protein [Streptomyces californicus]MCC0575254.1 hypothetical protein [Streptomyces californicus]